MNFYENLEISECIYRASYIAEYLYFMEDTVYVESSIVDLWD